MFNNDEELLDNFLRSRYDYWLDMLRNRFLYRKSKTRRLGRALAYVGSIGIWGLIIEHYLDRTNTIYVLFLAMVLGELLQLLASIRDSRRLDREDRKLVAEAEKRDKQRLQEWHAERDRLRAEENKTE